MFETNSTTWGRLVTNPNWWITKMFIDGEEETAHEYVGGINNHITDDLIEYVVYRTYDLKFGDVPKFIRQHKIEIYFATPNGNFDKKYLLDSIYCKAYEKEISISGVKNIPDKEKYFGYRWVLITNDEPHPKFDLKECDW